MKNTYSKITCFLIVLIANSCADCPESPYQEGENLRSDRKILLEEFTGFRCTNCPPAAEQAKALKDIYGDQLIVVALHADDNTFTQPLSNVPGEPFSTNFRTDEGVDYYYYYEISALPSGFVNRTVFNNSNVLSFGAWGDAIAVELAKESTVGLKFTSVEYNDTTRKLIVEVEAEAQSVNLSGNQYKFTLYFLESKIIEAQGYPGDSVNYEYQFDHVLRANLNSTWGELAFEGTIELGQIKTFTYEYEIPENFVVENSELVGYIYNNSLQTREIIQAEEFSLSDLE
jgi:Outer membrane protein Omp28